jgi:hypothetical protein
MNIKLSSGELRLRIARRELDTLLSSRAISLHVELPRNHAFRVNVRPAAIGGWLLESDPTGVWITIPRAELEALSQSLPNRDGLEHSFELANGGSVAVIFEVDIREQD